MEEEKEKEADNKERSSSSFSSFGTKTTNNCLAGWCFEPSQPLGIIPGLKRNTNPSLSYNKDGGLEYKKSR